MTIQERKKLLEHGQLKQIAESIDESPKFASAVLNDRALTYSKRRVAAMQAAIAGAVNRSQAELFG